jgi:hypothetical protein
MAPNKNNKSKRKSNKTLYLAIGIIAIILVGIGAYIIVGRSNQPANLTTTPTPTPTLTPSPTPTSSATTSPTSETDPLYIGGTKVLLHTATSSI